MKKKCKKEENQQKEKMIRRERQHIEKEEYRMKKGKPKDNRQIKITLQTKRSQRNIEHKQTRRSRGRYRHARSGVNEKRFRHACCHEVLRGNLHDSERAEDWIDPRLW